VELEAKAPFKSILRTRHCLLLQIHVEKATLKSGDLLPEGNPVPERVHRIEEREVIEILTAV